MVKETELEEGEARFDPNDANIDPDTALSYIDDRLQYALGHFRKDFEQEVSAEVLGPKYGWYGSFLPAYKLPPIVQSHGKDLSCNKPSSPMVFNSEGGLAPLNPVALVDPVKPAALPRKDVSVDDMASKDTPLSKNEITTSNSVNPTEKRSLKVRIKVGSYTPAIRTPAIKKDEIYGGLGLLTPPSSTSNNTKDGGDPPVESHDISLDSPGSILRDMCSIFVPGNRLLSPLNESLLCLKNKVMPLIMVRTKSFSIVDGSSYIENGMETETVDCKQGLVDDHKVKPSSDSVTSEANRAGKKDVPPKITETKKELIKDQLSDENYEQKRVKKLSLDSRGIRLIVCKNDPSVIKHDTDRFEKKDGLKAINCEPHEVKTPNNMANEPFERKNKLTGVHRKENSRSSLSGAMKDKKLALRDIVKVRNSYKDILDTDNGSVKVESVERNAIPSEVAVPPQTVVGPAVPPDNWVGCDRCEKWRLLPIGIEPDSLPEKWRCSMTTWLPGRNNCDIGEDETTRAVQEMNIQLISQNQISLQVNGSRGNIGNSDHRIPNVHSDTIANKFQKIKSRPPEGASSSLIETSRSSMDSQQHNRQKAKRLSETNQLLLEKKGDVKPKKLKHKIRSEQLSVSNGGHPLKDELVVSVQTQSENNLFAKKRKLEDWQESQHHANSENRIQRKEKRLKTEVKESSDDRCLSKGKTMKVKLSMSKENSVDTNHEKSQQHTYKITCKRDSESERFLHAATSSSSIVSGSCKRASLQESKGSLVRALNLDKTSLAVGKTISRKDIDASQRTGGKVDLKHREASKIRSSHNLEHTTDANNATDKYERSNFPRVKFKASDSLSGQPNKMRRVEEDVSAKIVNDGKIVGKKHAGSDVNVADMCSPEVNPPVKRSLKKVFVGDISKIRDSNEVQALDRAGQNRSTVMKQPESLVTHCGTLKNLSVVSFLKEFASSQSETALTAFKRAEESKDYADRLKISGFDYECSNAYFDSALKFLCAASLLEACTADISKSKGKDTINVYTTSAELFKICAREYEKRKEMFAAALAYKCMEVACMRIVYCKNLLTKKDLQTSMQMVTQGESPSSSASDVDNLNNQATMDKTMLSKSIAHHKNSIVVRNQANFTRLLDLTSDVSLAMEASVKAQNVYKLASAVLEEAQNKEMITTVKRAVNFSFHDVKEFACLVQNAREAVDRQGNKRQYSS